MDEGGHAGDEDPRGGCLSGHWLCQVSGCAQTDPRVPGPPQQTTMNHVA